MDVTVVVGEVAVGEDDDAGADAGANAGAAATEGAGGDDGSAKAIVGAVTVDTTRGSSGTDMAMAAYNCCRLVMNASKSAMAHAGCRMRTKVSCTCKGSSAAVHDACPASHAPTRLQVKRIHRTGPERR
jgi:hypothetical protein